MSRIWSVRLAGALCLAGCLLPNLLHFLPDRNRMMFIHDVEKREPAGWPSLRSPADLLDLETYRRLSEALRDWLPFRGEVVFLKNRLERRLLGETKFGDVVIGKNGWLFLESSYWRPFEDEAKVRRVLAMLDYTLAHPPRGCDLRVLIGPDKDAICPEYLRGRDLARAQSQSRRRELLYNYCRDRLDRKVIGLWREYREAKKQSPEPIFYRQDTHHTQFAATLILARSLVEAFRPGLWDMRDIRFLGTKPKVADLALLAGLGPWTDEQRSFDLIRPGIRRDEKILLGPDRGWRSPARYLTSSATREMIPGRTLILHDSYLAENRETLRQFFSDVTFAHYEDVIAEGDPAAMFGKFDRVVVEMAERQSLFMLNQLLAQLNARPAVEISLASVQNFNPGQARTSLRPEGMEISAQGPDPAVLLPALGLPAGHHYALRVRLDSNVRTSVQLMYQDQTGQTYVNERSTWRNAQAGTNEIMFEVRPVQTKFPLRLDPGYTRGEYRLLRLRMDEVLPAGEDPWEAAAAELHRLADSEMPAFFQSAAGGKSDAWFTGRIEPNTGTGIFRDPRGVWIRASHQDPQLLLPAAAAPGSHPRLEVRLTVPAATECQLFYLETPGGSYSERQSFRRQVVPGENRLEFSLRPAWLKNGLRFDPGSLAGEYRLNTLSYSGIERPQPAAGESSNGRGERGTLWVIYPWARAGAITPQLSEGSETNGRLRLTPQGGGFILSCLGADPQWEWPPLPKPDFRASLLRLTVYAPAETTCGFFTRPVRGGIFTEAARQSRPLRTGRNVLTFALPGNSLACGVRLDPGGRAGEYRLDAAEPLVLREAAGRRLFGEPEYAALPAEALGAIFSLGCTEPIFELDLSQPPGVEFNSFLRARPDGGSLHLQALDRDPFFILPGIRARPRDAYLLRIYLDAPQPTSCQVFYLRPGQSRFQELRSSRRPLNTGINVVYFYLPGEVLGRPLRFDPGEVPGEYRLRGWQIRRLIEP